VRAAGWPRLLNNYLIEAQKRYVTTGFEWGRFDCCTFVSDWVLRCTGVDPMADLRGKYSDRDQALALLEQGSLATRLIQAFGEPIHWAESQRGDIAYRADLNACGIYFTSGSKKFALFLGDGGFSLHRPGETGLAFRVE